MKNLLRTYAYSALITAFLLGLFKLYLFIRTILDEYLGISQPDLAENYLFMSVSEIILGTTALFMSLVPLLGLVILIIVFVKKLPSDFYILPLYAGFSLVLALLLGWAIYFPPLMLLSIFLDGVQVKLALNTLHKIKTL